MSIIIKKNFDEAKEMALPEFTGVISVLCRIEEKQRKIADLKEGIKTFSDINNGITVDTEKEKLEYLYQFLFYRMVDVNAAYEKATKRYVMRFIDKTPDNFIKLYKELDMVI